MKEKTADEMFDDEGMWLEYENLDEMIRQNDDLKTILINKKLKFIKCYNEYGGSKYISFNELKAIFKYFYEQGWLDE